MHVAPILTRAPSRATRGYIHPDDRHLASAAEQANEFLSTDGQRKHALPGAAAPHPGASDAVLRPVKNCREVLVPLPTGHCPEQLFQQQKLPKTAPQAQENPGGLGDIYQGFYVGLTGFEPATP